MPKIPTFTSSRSITTATPSVETNIQLDLRQTPAGALQPVSKFLEESYVQEKTAEANNKSYKLLNSFYEDKKDDQGNVVQKGWLTIASEAKQKDNPTEASNYYDSEVEKLYNYKKINDFAKLNNFEKKAIDRKFYATSGLLKTKVIEEARLNLIAENKKVDDDTFVKESLLLKELGTDYIEQFKINTTNRINSNPDYDEGVKKQLIDTYNSKGVEFLATSMANNQPSQFKIARSKGAFDDVDAAKILELEAVADDVIKKQKYQTLLSPLDIPFDADPRDFVIANEEIKAKTFGGNEDLQAIYQSLKPQERIEFEKEYLKKANQIKSDRQLQILTANQIGKVEAAQKTNEIFKMLDMREGVYSEKLKQIFPDNQIAVEQLIDFNTKLSDGQANKISKFENNDDIIKLIINDKVNTVYDKFTLTGETTPLSIMERVGKQLNVKDVKFLNNLLSISQEDGFKENHTEFFKFIDMFSLEVAGSVALKDLDPKRDDRLNVFKYTMYARYINGLQNGKTPAQLLKAAKGNKDFIGYDFHTFLPSMDDVFKSIKDNISANEDIPQIPDAKTKTKKQIEEELGRPISIEEYLKIIEGN